MSLTREDQLALGLPPPAKGEEEFSRVEISKAKKPKRFLHRQRITLSENDALRVRDRMFKVVTEWENNTTLLHQRLRRYNNQLEGIKAPKDFPWKNSSNLHIPLTEIHLTTIHSILSETLIYNDPVWTSKLTIPEGPEATAVDRDVEAFLNFVTRGHLQLEDPMDQFLFNACRDPLSVMVLDWVEDYETRFDIAVFDSVSDFQNRFTSPKEAGCSLDTYKEFIAQINGPEGQAVVKVKEYAVAYRGPLGRIVELKDFVIVPVTSPTIRYAMFYGDQFTQRANYFKTLANAKWFDDEEVEAMLSKPGTSEARDLISQQQDRIEGLGRARSTPVDEYHCVQGNLSIDLDNDDEEELYHVVFHKDTKAILRFEEYPYWHNRPNYIAGRIRGRSNRLLGRCVPDMLFDLNEEVDTQHNQRIDARTITLVPSFKKKDISQVNLARIDQSFYPGVTFTVKTMDEFEQMQITQTDMGQSLQEEANLFQVAETLTGATAARSGQSSTRDPRAPAKKVQALIAQSNQKIDSYIKWLKPAMNEIGSQILDLYYQFTPDYVSFPSFDKGTKTWVTKDIQRKFLRSRTRSIEIARTSVSDNPDTEMQRALVEYQIWSKNQLVNQEELTRRTMLKTRVKNIDSLILGPKERMQQSQEQGIHKQLQNGPQGDDQPNGMREGGPDLSPQTLTKGRPK